MYSTVMELSQRKITKIYRALVHGIVDEDKVTLRPNSYLLFLSWSIIFLIVSFEVLWCLFLSLSRIVNDVLG